MKQLYKLILSILLCFSMLSCNGAYIDDDTKLTRKELLDDMVRVPRSEDGRLAPPISRSNTPNISKLLVAPPPPPMGNGKLISFSVTEEVPLKDVLVELGRVADIDIEVDPNIEGGIILKVTNKPLNVIVERIAELGSLRYTYQNGILRFVRDVPYSKTYDIDFLIDNDIWGSMENNFGEIVDLYRPAIVSADGSDAIPDPKIFSNKEAGLITVYANDRTQKAVGAYMLELKRNYSAQVLIEAKVVEIRLNKDFQMGIDWKFLQDSPITGITRGLEFTPLGGVVGSTLKTGVFGGDLSATIKALDQFGSTKTISSPRIHAINNQEAELKFVNKLIYFSIERNEQTSVSGGDSTTNVTETATRQEEDVGVILTITPSINLNKNEITLKVVPELKVKIDEVVDPTNEKNLVPVVQTRSVNTSLRINSGNVLVIGGLMTEDNSNNDSGIPFLSSVPVLGYLFKGTERSKDIIETVIFIKATIVRPDGRVNGRDLELYQKYGDGKTDFLY